MTRLISQMLKLPLTALVYTMEMLVKTMEGLKRIADQGIDAMMNGATQTFGAGHGDESEPKNGTRANELIQSAINPTGGDVALAFNSRTSETSDIVAGKAKTASKEERKMPDTNLSDEMLKLVRYKILFVKRDYETAFPEVEELVHDNLTGSAYSGWKIAQFIQNLRHGKTIIPTKWEDDYPPDDKDSDGNYKYKKDGKLIGFPEEDKKYLRVYFEVLDRYVREEFRYEEDQIDVLKEIRDALKDKGRGGSYGSGSHATAGGAAAGGGRGTGGGGSAGEGSGAAGGGIAGGGRGTAST